MRMRINATLNYRTPFGIQGLSLWFARNYIGCQFILPGQYKLAHEGQESSDL